MEPQVGCPHGLNSPFRIEGAKELKPQKAVGLGAGWLMPDKRVAEYRQKALECESEAMGASRPADRAEWLKLAEQWTSLAEALEHEIAIRKGPEPNKDPKIPGY
jgi:hypothetical protein